MPHILITGASRRLGLLLCESFIRQKWQVTALTRHASDELTALGERGVKVICLDYSDTRAIADCCQQLEAVGLDAIIHNASFFAPDETNPQASQQQLQAMLQTHLFMPQQINQALADTLKQSTNANIIHMSDIYVDNPNELYSNYCASKAALENLSMSFAKRLAPKVRVNTIQPGALAFLPEHTEAAKNQVLEQSLLKKAAGFEPIIQTIHYLLNNAFVTGTSIKVDGGRSISR